MTCRVPRSSLPPESPGTPVWLVTRAVRVTVREHVRPRLAPRLRSAGLRPGRAIIQRERGVQRLEPPLRQLRLIAAAEQHARTVEPIATDLESRRPEPRVH